ncbi:MAG: ABC transporter ATP-binding protein [Actinomycetota bacterium]
MTLSVDVSVSRGSFRVSAAFDAEEGETRALLGPNGSGKSTVVETLAGLLDPDDGRVELDGVDLTEMPPTRRPVGVVFQDLRLFPHLSALDNVAFPLRARKAPRAEARARAADALEGVGAAKHASARPTDLSGGERQRVALARALVTQPRLLLLDEPLSALDVRSRRELRTLLRETLAAFDGVRILVTHDPVEAMTLANRIVILEDGEVTHRDTPSEIRSAPRTPYAAELVGLNLFSGTLRPLEPGTAMIASDAGDVVVGRSDDVPENAEVVGLLRPADVILHAEKPAGSARNVLHGRVELVSVEGERARVRLATTPPVTAEITLGSAERLGVKEGAELYASFKALEVRVLPA